MNVWVFDRDALGAPPEGVTVRPDGNITLPLLNEIAAAGLRPEQLRAAITEQAVKFIEDPAVTVIVKKINSRKVYITGQVEKLTEGRTILTRALQADLDKITDLIVAGVLE